MTRLPWRGLGTLIILLAGLLLMLPGGAMAASAEGVISPESAKASSDDPPKVTLALVNATGQPVSLDPSLEASPGCYAKAEPGTIGAWKTDTVTVTLPKGCDVTSTRRLLLGAGLGSTLIKPADPTAPEGADIYAKSATLALVSLLVPACYLIAHWRGDAGKRSAAQQHTRALVVAALTNQVRELNQDALKRFLKASFPEKSSPWTPLRGLAATWSFKDSWLANINTASVGVVTLVATTGALDAVFGPQAKAVGLFLALPAAVGAVLVALAIAALRAFGPDPSGVTVLGFLIAAALGLFATVFKVATATWAVFATAPVHDALKFLLVVAGGVGVGLTVKYAATGCRATLVKGLSHELGTESDTLKAAWLIAHAIRPETAPITEPSPIVERPWVIAFCDAADTLRASDRPGAAEAGSSSRADWQLGNYLLPGRGDTSSRRSALL
jgi:hypothetical protein